MNEANQILGAIQRKKAIYRQVMATCKSERDKHKLKRDIGELSKEEEYWLRQLDEEFKVD